MQRPLGLEVPLALLIRADRADRMSGGRGPHSVAVHSAWHRKKRPPALRPRTPLAAMALALHVLDRAPPRSRPR